MSRSNLAQDIKFPVGRILMGNLYKASDKDADGKPRIVKQGANAGQATQQYFFAVGYPKTPGAAHWAYEPWGAIIWAVGNGAFPKIAENPSFSWKIVDGDSTVPNKKGIAPVTREGYPGHWVVSFASSYAPKVVNADGSAYLLEPNTVMPGDFVEVHATIDGNASTQNPGVYINYNVVSFQGHSVLGRIHTTGVDPTTVGFGQGPKPAGYSAVPIGAIPGAAPKPAAAPPPTLPGPKAAVPPPTAAAVPVVPSASFLGAPAAVPPPGAAMPPPVAAPIRTMSAKAQGNSYEQLKAQGWTDALLTEHGMFA